MTTRTSAYQIIDHEGKLAIKAPLGESWDKPVRQTLYYVSDLLVGDFAWWLGARSTRIDGDTFTFMKDGMPATLNPTRNGWERVIVETAIKPPGRGSKNFRWAWSSGKWRKEYL
jgi:hypothetical protein